MSDTIIPTSSDTVTIDLSNAEYIGRTGQRIDILLPNGVVADLWVFAGDTTSVDVRSRLSHDFGAPNAVIPRTFSIPSATAAKSVAVVLK